MRTTDTQPDVGELDLFTQVARLGRLEPPLVERLRHEALTVPTGWVAEYGEYQSGGWWTLSLLNDSGDPRHVTIRDCRPVATSLLERMPVTRDLLYSLGVSYMWARLARLEPNAYLWEHRDYGELEHVERHRLHIPLATNSSAFLVLGGVRVRLRAGRIWRLAPAFPHGACNLFGPDRLHLILDCYADDALARLSAGADLADVDIQPLPTLSQTRIDAELDMARDLARLGYTHTAERHLLRLFYHYAVPEGRLYDLVAALYMSLDRPESADYWREKKARLLGVSSALLAESGPHRQVGAS